MIEKTLREVSIAVTSRARSTINDVERNSFGISPLAKKIRTTVNGAHYQFYTGRKGEWVNITLGVVDDLTKQLDAGLL